MLGVPQVVSRRLGGGELMMMMTVVTMLITGACRCY